MSLRTLPILFFNMGGEMLYILEQRLKAQHVLPERATRGLNNNYKCRMHRSADRIELVVGVGALVKRKITLQ